jgi:ABC-2 type transport system permease protein
METILSSRTSFRVFLLGESVFRFLVGSYFLIASLVMGFIIGAKFNLTLGSALAATILTVLLIASHMVVGVLGAGAILKLKQGDPIVWAFTWLTQLFSGVLYPLGLLPGYLQWVGAVFPLTFSLDGLRRCLMNGEDLTSIAILGDAAKLVVFIVVMLPVSLWVFKVAYDSTRREGALGQY